MADGVGKLRVKAWFTRNRTKTIATLTFVLGSLIGLKGPYLDLAVGTVEKVYPEKIEVPKDPQITSKGDTLYFDENGNVKKVKRK